MKAGHGAPGGARQRAILLDWESDMDTGINVVTATGLMSATGVTDNSSIGRPGATAGAWYRHARSPALALLAALISGSALAEVKFSADAGIRWEDNIGLASASDDKVEDFTIELGAGLDWNFVETATAEVGVHGGVYHQEVDEISDISRSGFEGTAHYQGQSSGDLTAFWWKFDGEIRTLKHRDSEIRDGYIWELGVAIGKRFNQKFGLSGGYRYERREATEDAGQNPIWRSNEVFDLKKDVLFVMGDFALGPVTTLFLEFTYKEGDEATSGRFIDEFGWLGTSIPWGWDSAFGPDYQVWKVDAKQYIYEVGIAHSFTDKFSIDAGYSYVDADAVASWWGPISYKNNVLTATVMYSF